MLNHQGAKLTPEQHERYMAAQAKWAANEHPSGSPDDRETAYLEMRHVEREAFGALGLDPRYFYQVAFDGAVLAGHWRGEYAALRPQPMSGNFPDHFPEDFGGGA